VERGIAEANAALMAARELSESAHMRLIEKIKACDLRATNRFSVSSVK
jgi:hypothetical protein